MAPISAFHKIAKRRFDDISSVAVAYRAAIWTASSVEVDIKIGLGGVAATPLRATATEEFLTGKAVDPRHGRARPPTMLGQEGTPIE